MSSINQSSSIIINKISSSSSSNNNNTFRFHPSFFTPVSVPFRHENSPNEQSIRSNNSSRIIRKEIFESRRIIGYLSHAFFNPRYRNRLTNYIFVAAFTSACMCVGAQSIFPDSKFHSSDSLMTKNNLRMIKLEKNSSIEEEEEEAEEDDRISYKKELNNTNSSFGLRIRSWNFFDLGFCKDQNQDSQKKNRQRKWLEEELP